MPRCQRTGFRRSAQRRRRSTVYGEPTPPAPSVLYRSRKPQLPLLASATEHEAREQSAARLGGCICRARECFRRRLSDRTRRQSHAAPAVVEPAARQLVPGRRRKPGRRLPAVDWQAMQAAGRVHHSPDPSAQDTAFTGGTEEDKPGLWDLTTEAGGVNPGKANILDAWSSFDPQGGNAFLYLGFAREAASLLTDASTSRRDDVHHVRAQPRPATMGQRTGHDSMPDHGRRARLVRVAGQRCQRRDPTLGHDDRPMRRAGVLRRDASTTSRASRRMSTLRARSTDG